VTGRVSYYQDYPDGDPIINAVVKDITGSPLALTTPTYTLQFPHEAIDVATITASRTTENDDKDAITGYDLIRTLRYLGFIDEFTADQERAADVNRNGSVDVSDAQFMAQWLAFLFNPPCNPEDPGNTNCTGKWAFRFNPEGADEPDAITISLDCDPSSVDVKGFLLGDVDGSWPTPFKPGVVSQVGLEFALVEQSESELTVALLADVEREGIESMLFSLTYDEAVLEFAGMQPGATAPPELFVVNNDSEPGVTHGVVASWKEPIAAAGELLRFRFRVTGGGAQEPLTFSRLRVNDRGAATIPALDIDVGGPRQQDAVPLPTQYSMKASPNPFNPAARIEYAIPAGAGLVPVRLRVYDITGRLVRTLVEETRQPGVHVTTWDGRDNAGTEARSGLYLARIQAGDWVRVEKISLVK
jgi:hypothetical protein